jgi:hypothetical protein
MVRPRYDRGTADVRLGYDRGEVRIRLGYGRVTAAVRSVASGSVVVLCGSRKSSLFASASQPPNREPSRVVWDRSRVVGRTVCVKCQGVRALPIVVRGFVASAPLALREPALLSPPPAPQCLDNSPYKRPGVLCLRTRHSRGELTTEGGEVVLVFLWRSIALL